MFSCPECDQSINQSSEDCPFCGADLTSPIFAGDPKPARKSRMRIVLTWGILLATLWAIAWFAFPWRLTGTKPTAESNARDALAAVRQSLMAYQASEDSFPASLESLGDSVRAAAQKAQSARYTLEYAPGKPNSDGRVKTFTLLARPGNFGYLNFYTDETGVFRATREDRPATSQDPPFKPVS
jgi:hypothetical protein